MDGSRPGSALTGEARQQARRTTLAYSDHGESPDSRQAVLYCLNRSRY